ncbi:hypothetical protein TIFTF001_039507 [Ficus carica]|uniref:Uncharacterized protein n=1 Tax=Ficus carica TaxID=3494 RepID=A0AA88EF83_FICCA|nr:hypothetical protein TIFTF001_039483 [Ficus carica]GMN70454.1 hypothetical protein TIFTF001_039491 [Ficus carica]GMN70457.1 hypothetical protein TIFTF001_039499 [Ficus carica]GMN70470.1 hypothetical protein TIFTF001_039507 [Ficus carica]
MRNSTSRVAFFCPSPIVIVRQIKPIAQTHSLANPYSGDMPNNIINYLDFFDQSIVMWVEKLVGFITGEAASPKAVPFRISGSSHVLSWRPGECIDRTFLQEFWAVMQLQLYRVPPLNFLLHFGVLLCYTPQVRKEQFLTCMMVLSKRSKYPFKGSFSPCLILNKYEVSFFLVFALRNTTKKASDNCLNESSTPVSVFALQVLINVRGAIIRSYGRHFKSSRVRCSHHCGVKGGSTCRATAEVCFLAADVGHVFSGQLGVWRPIPHGMLELLTKSPYCGDSLSTHTDHHCLAAKESTASSSRVGWGSVPQNSLKALASIQMISIKFWTFLVRIFVYVGFRGAHVLDGLPSALGTVRGRVLVALVVLVGLLFHVLSKGPPSNAKILMPKIFDTTLDGSTRRDPPCTIMLHLVAYKSEAPQSKNDTSGVSAKGTPMLKSAFPTGSSARVTLMGRIPSDPGG